MIGNKIIGIASGDWHWGSPESDNLDDTLRGPFFDEINRIGHDLEIVEINGDYFNHKLSLNSQYGQMALLFMQDLVMLSRKYNFKIRMLKGTKSHDLRQLDNFKKYEVTDDFMMYNTITEETIFGLKWLFIPEEYPNDQDEYYKEYRDVLYDRISGHGTFKFQAHTSQISESENTVGKVIFANNTFQCNGPIIFGHIHPQNVYNNRIYYPGSINRWHFGEDKVKGFYRYEINKEDPTDYQMFFIENPLAKKYQTFILDELLASDVTMTKTLIEELKKEGELRIKIDKGVDMAKVEILKGGFSKDVKFLRQNEVKIEVDADMMFLFSEDTAENKLSTYIKLKKDRDISPDRIITLLQNEGVTQNGKD